MAGPRRFELRLSVLETDVLAVNTMNPQLVVRDGIEPSTEAFSAPYSTRLSYLTIKLRFIRSLLVVQI